MNSRENIKQYILSKLQQEYSIKEETDIEHFNYVDTGYVDSMGIIQFLAELEEYFDIEFSDEEMSSDEFKVVGKLINMIADKVRSEG